MASLSPFTTDLVYSTGHLCQIFLKHTSFSTELFVPIFQTTITLDYIYYIKTNMQRLGNGSVKVHVSQ